MNNYIKGIFTGIIFLSGIFLGGTIFKPDPVPVPTYIVNDKGPLQLFHSIVDETENCYIGLGNTCVERSFIEHPGPGLYPRSLVIHNVMGVTIKNFQFGSYGLVNPTGYRVTIEPFDPLEIPLNHSYNKISW